MHASTNPPRPAPPPPPADLPHPLTFFVARRDRTAILRALRRIDRDRARALLHALGVRVEPPGRRAA